MQTERLNTRVHVVVCDVELLVLHIDLFVVF